VVAVLAVVLALAMVPLTPAGFPVLAAAVVALAVGAVDRHPDSTEIPGRDDLSTGGHHS
jgi:hypothetical protein